MVLKMVVISLFLITAKLELNSEKAHRKTNTGTMMRIIKRLKYHELEKTHLSHFIENCPKDL